MADDKANSLAIFCSEKWDESQLEAYDMPNYTIYDSMPRRQNFIKKLISETGTRILVIDEEFGWDYYGKILNNKGSTQDNTLIIIAEDKYDVKLCYVKEFACKTFRSYDEITDIIAHEFQLEKDPRNEDHDGRIRERESSEGPQNDQLKAKKTSPPKDQGKEDDDEKIPKSERIELNDQWKAEQDSLKEGAETTTPQSLLKKNAFLKENTEKIIFLAVAVALFAWLMLGPVQPPSAPIPPPEPTPIEKYISKIDSLKNGTNQVEKFWRVVRSLKHQINETDPREPAVLMLVSMKNAAKTREHLARGIAKAYSTRCSNAVPVMVSGGDYSNMDDDDAKERIDDKITSGFLAKSCATVVSNFEKLPPASTKVFYQFCENDSAPFKKVAVIFTLEIEDGDWDEDDDVSADKPPNQRKWDKIVDEFIHYSLKTRDTTDTMTVDMISPLLSRIAPAVAWVK